MTRSLKIGKRGILIASLLSNMPLVCATDFPPDPKPPIPFEIEPIVQGETKSGRELRRERRKSNRKNNNK